MKLKNLIYLFALSTPLTANADFLSVAAGGGLWNDAPSGTYNKANEQTIDVENELFWSSEAQGYLFVTFEHFVPLVPNVKLMSTKIDHSGSGTAASSFTYDGDIYTTNNNDISIKELDLYLYYEMLDNIVSLDLGLNIRKLTVDFNISDSTNSGNNSIDKTIPMLYALVGGSPWPGLRLSGEMSYMSLQGNTLSDFTAKIEYTTSFFVGFEGGYRNQTIKLDDVSGTNSDMSFNGVFAGAYVKF